MKTSALIFMSGLVFFTPVAFIYGFLTDFTELVGFPAMLLLGLMAMMIGGGLWLEHRRIGRIPADDLEGEISEEPYEYGFYSPWSWWPLTVAAGGAVAFLGVAVGMWIVPFGAVIAIVGLVGLVYEYDRGNHAH
ncbi:cytochrome c oxidase subunit 4 [Brevibacterium samyangense]|uniref:Cytochrome c oxidase polypeptide 4 n=1 Tax=Brevibacterium samyangense TaxID=366888 RepID=A0ABP5EYA7_9MICO